MRRTGNFWNCYPGNTEGQRVLLEVIGAALFIALSFLTERGIKLVRTD